MVPPDMAPQVMVPLLPTSSEVPDMVPPDMAPDEVIDALLFTSSSYKFVWSFTVNEFTVKESNLPLEKVKFPQTSRSPGITTVSSEVPSMIWLPDVHVAEYPIAVEHEKFAHVALDPNAVE